VVKTTCLPWTGSSRFEVLATVRQSFQRRLEPSANDSEPTLRRIIVRKRWRSSILPSVPFGASRD
jgi:hypothetical protein